MNELAFEQLKAIDSRFEEEIADFFCVWDERGEEIS